MSDSSSSSGLPHTCEKLVRKSIELERRFLTQSLPLRERLQLLENLLHEVRMHFSEQEEFIRRHECGDADSHLHAHRVLSAQIAEVIQLARTYGLSPETAILRIRGVLQVHEKGPDARFQYFFSLRDPPPG